MNLFRFNLDFESEISKKAMLYNANLFIHMRWIAVLAIFSITFIAKKIFSIGVEYRVFYLIGFIVFLYNIVILAWFKFIQSKCKEDLCVKNALVSSHIQIMLDMIALGLLIHFSGGIESPFFYILIFHPIFASIILTTRIAFFYALISIAIAGILSMGEHLKIIDHHHIKGFLPNDNVSSFLFSFGSFAAFTVIQITVVIITSSIIKDLRKKQNHIEKIKKELEEKNKTLKKKDEMRLLFLASATHDLKSPLNTITSYIQTMLDGYVGNIPTDQKNILKRILNRIIGLRQMISDVLALGEIEMDEGKEIKRERFDIIKLLIESIQEFQPQASERGIKINFIKDTDSFFILADPQKIDEAIHNYLSNAIKYNKENGTITISAQTEGDNIRISVKDTGIGIKEEEIPRLFTDFFRSADVKKNKIEGTGLGLGITKRIIERYGGSVGVESKYQEGSTFFFVLPGDNSEQNRTGTTA